MNKVASFFDDILKLVGASYLFLIVAGFLDLKIYYANFGVSINEYISISEILFSALDKIVLIIIVLVFQLAFWLHMFEYLFEYDLNESIKDGERRPKKYHDETTHRFFRSKKIRVYWIIILSGTIISTLIALFFPKITFLEILKDFFLLNYWVAMCLYFLWIQASRGLWEILNKRTDNEAKIIVTIIVFISVLFLSIWVKNAFLYNRFQRRNNKMHIEMFLNENVKIKANDTVRYIGRTENYIFYRDMPGQRTIIIPSSEVKKIVIE